MVKKKAVVEEEAVEVAKVDSDIFKLAATGNLELIQKLVEAEGSDIDINGTDAMECTALVWASRSGHVKVMDYLIGKGADVEKAGYGGLRPLHHACNNMKEDAMSKLIDGGCDVMAKDENGCTPLHWSSSRGALSQCVLLIDKGADLNAVNNIKSTPLMKACINGQTTSAERYIKLDKNVVNAKDQDGNSALHFAARGGFDALVSVLVEAGAPKDSKNKDGSTPLDLAFTKSAKEVLAA